jgi:hypothetical protein
LRFKAVRDIWKKRSNVQFNDERAGRDDRYRHLSSSPPTRGAPDDEYHDRESDELQPADCL